MFALNDVIIVLTDALFLLFLNVMFIPAGGGDGGGGER
jgi:hypothetical protein